MALPFDPEKTPAPEPNEFDQAEKTPAGVIITAKEVTIFRRGARTVVKGFMPWVPKIAIAAGPALGVLLLGMFQHWSSKADERIHESSAKTERAYKAATAPQRDLAVEIEKLQKRLTAAEATNEAQSALIVARERDFVVEGRPAKVAKRRRVDPGLVKAVQANAAKDAKELAARTAKPAPKIALPPAEIPPAPKSDQAQQAPPSAPTQPQDATP
jgi:hypothetical protein